MRAAQDADQEVILTISGTPRWANGGKNPNVMPTRIADFTNFTRAIASRYSGRFMGYPFVRFFSIWNEPNLQLFLSPQFDAQGRSVAPSELRKARRCRVQRRQGREPASADRDRRDLRPRERQADGAPADAHAGQVRRARREGQPEAEVRRVVAPSVPVQPELAAVAAREVAERRRSLRSRASTTNLKKWFKRKTVPIWITEYGHQTQPEDSLGVSYATQAAYIQQSISMAARYPFVNMFIWFVYQDDQGQPWESGIYTRNGAPKGSSPARFAASARPFDPRNDLLLLKRGTLTPLVNVYTRRYCATDPTGELIGMTWRVFRGGRLIEVGQQTAPLRADCTIAARIRIPGGVVRGTTYTATFAMNDADGVVLNRRLTIRGTSSQLSRPRRAPASPPTTEGRRVTCRRS